VTRDAVAAGLGWEIGGEKKIADWEELRDVFSVMGSEAGSKILRGLDAAGRGFVIAGSVGYGGR
jgi:hypothetical protein